MVSETKGHLLMMGQPLRQPSAKTEPDPAPGLKVRYAAPAKQPLLKYTTYTTGL